MELISEAKAEVIETIEDVKDLDEKQKVDAVIRQTLNG
jgi:hypothetical protein